MRCLSVPSDKVASSAELVGLPRAALAAACNAVLETTQHIILCFSGKQHQHWRCAIARFCVFHRVNSAALHLICNFGEGLRHAFG